MMTLREALNRAKENKIAIGHFNISDSTQFNAIIQGVLGADIKSATSVFGTSMVPVIIGVSEGEESFVGMQNAVALVQAAQEKGLPVYLNADHHHSVEACKAVIGAGFDSVIYDGVSLPLEENIENTRQVVEYARQSGKDIIVESELGYIGTSSKMLDEVPEDVLEAALPSVEDAVRFVKETGVDALAPAVGNLHGMLKNMPNPHLQIDLIRQIRDALPDTHLVLHGGSGIRDEEFKQAINAGMNCVHINTEIRKAYRSGIEKGLQNNPDQIAPYKYMADAKSAVEEVVKERVKLFSSL